MKCANIEFPDFTKAEFKPPFTIEKLYKVLRNDFDKESLPDETKDEDKIKVINGLLERFDLYDKISSRKKAKPPFSNSIKK